MKNLNIVEIHQEALNAAIAAEKEFVQKYGETPYCGFAWVKFHVDGRSNIAKQLLKNGIVRKAWNHGYDAWNPTGNGTQSMDIKEMGSEAYASVWRKYGVKAYMESRAD